VNNGTSILLVDDEPQIVEVLERYLTDEGFRVHKAYDGQTAVALASSEQPHLVLLDLKLPGMSGFEAFREIRAASSVPIIMLTSRGEEVDRIVGLELGADDYITKPFSPREVVARIKAVLRRAHASTATLASPNTIIRNGDIEIDPRDHEVRVRGTVVGFGDPDHSQRVVRGGSPQEEQHGDHQVQPHRRQVGRAPANEKFTCQVPGAEQQCAERAPQP